MGKTYNNEFIIAREPAMTSDNWVEIITHGFSISYS